MEPHAALRACALGALALHLTGAGAQSVFCSSDLGRRIDGDLEVAAPCVLEGADVRGDVTLYSGGSLTARGVRIRGDLLGSRADFVDLERTTIDGELRLDEMVGDSSRIERVDVRGNVALADNRSQIDLLDSDVRGAVEVADNTGGVLIEGNTIDGGLVCDGNDPAPTVEGNRVRGEREGQCAEEEGRASPPVRQPDPPEPTPQPTPSPPVSPAPSPAQPPSSPVQSPKPAAPSGDATTNDFVADPNGGGGGAFGWPALLLLLPLAALRGRRRAPTRRP